MSGVRSSWHGQICWRVGKSIYLAMAIAFHTLLVAPADTLSDFGAVLLFILGGIIFAIIGTLANRLIGPKRPNPEKLTTYESGEAPIGDAVIQLNTRFYLVGLIFLIFDVEVLFLYPWATVFADRDIIQAVPEWGTFVMVEMMLFAGILILGLIYAWIKGDLEWVKPQPTPPSTTGLTTASRYESVNKKYQGVKAPESS